MRELPLQLAAQGKLAERKENDGTVWTIFPEGLPPAGLSRYEVADQDVGVPGRMDYWEEPGPHTDSSKVSSDGSWILSSARTNG